MRRSRLSLVATLAVASSAALVGVPAVADAAPKPKPPVAVQLIAMNDFHGRIQITTGSDSELTTAGPDGLYGTADDVKEIVGGSAHVAATVQQLQSSFAAENGAKAGSFFVGAGDLISASPFESSVFKDEPTIEVLDAMGLDVSSVGNHEFDRGTEELRRISAATDGTFTDDVTACDGITPGVDGCFGEGEHAFDGADFPYLAANVISKETGEPILPPYQVFNAEGGRKIALIGVVTETTPGIVSPAGVADVTFIDEADAVNEYVPELTRRGVEAIGVLIHEGGTQTGPTAADPNGCDTLTGPIVDINDRIDPEVDLIVSAHTHQAYNCRLAVPGGEDRLVTSAGFYGRLVSDIRLTLDGRTGEVDRSATYGATNVPVTRTAADADVQSIVDYWVARSAEVGNRVVGQQAGDLDRAYRAGAPVRDSESSLGNLIADAQLAAANAPGSVLGGGDLAFMNPGGIRADLNCAPPAGSGQASGDITFAETFTVQPFSNTVNAVDLTGAAIDEILEQQWAMRGTSLSFLQLSVSSNVQYTFDPNAPLGQRIDPAEILIDGVPLDPAGTYRVIANSFLIGGGDSFTSFVTGRAGGSTPITGVNDVDAFNAYLAAQPGPVSAPTLDRALSTDPAQQFNDDLSGNVAC